MDGNVSSRTVDWGWNHRDPIVKSTDRQTVFFSTADDRKSFGSASLGVDVSAPSGHNAVARVAF